MHHVYRDINGKYPRLFYGEIFYISYFLAKVNKQFLRHDSYCYFVRSSKVVTIWQSEIGNKLLGTPVYKFFDT